MSKKNQTYDEFIEKFKLKKTTEDCYTPSLCMRLYLAGHASTSKICDWYVKRGILCFFYFYSMNLFLNKFCIFAVENKTRHCMLEYEKDIIPTRILRHGQLSDGESLERGV